MEAAGERLRVLDTRYASRVVDGSGRLRLRGTGVPAGSAGPTGTEARATRQVFVLSGFVISLFTLPISAAATGVAFRVLYERTYPGSGPQ